MSLRITLSFQFKFKYFIRKNVRKIFKKEFFNIKEIIYERFIKEFLLKN